MENIIRKMLYLLLESKCNEIQVIGKKHALEEDEVIGFFNKNRKENIVFIYNDWNVYSETPHVKSLDTTEKLVHRIETYLKKYDISASIEVEEAVFEKEDEIVYQAPKWLTDRLL